MVDNVDSSISRARFSVTIFLIVTNDPHYEVLMSAVKTDQSEGIPGAGIPEQAVKKMLRFFSPTISEPGTGYGSEGPKSPEVFGLNCSES